MSSLPLAGLAELRSITSGRPEIVVGLIDGPVFEGSGLREASLTTAPGYENLAKIDGPATRHGTFVAHLLFGADGICPGCKGVLAPILSESDGGLIPADQFGLARALQVCAEEGAALINVSAGQRAVVPEADGILAQALAHCREKGALVVAAAGNSGCDCADIPAALPGVLAVGSHGPDGAPSAFSNFGAHYAQGGLLAPGEAIGSFDPTGEATAANGTSYAAAIVTGVAALLLSAALERGRTMSPAAVGEALLASAAPCAAEPGGDSHPGCLAGRLDILAAMERLGLAQEEAAAIGGDGSPQAITLNVGRDVDMTIGLERAAQAAAAGAAGPMGSAGMGAQGAGLLPSDCGCGGGGKSCGCGGHGACTCGDKGAASTAAAPQLVYALGTLDVDFGTEARRDAFLQAMPDGTSPNNPDQLAAFLAENPVYEQGLTWVLRLDASPIYAIKPAGTYARETADRLREIYRRQYDQDIEIVSVPAFMTGQARLMSGMTVPVLYTDVRGLYAWDVPTLASALEAAPGPRDPAANLDNFLNRIYYEFRNLGVTPQERALNYSATNAFQYSQVFSTALENNMAFDSLAVNKSPLCRPDSDCWDVVMTFFTPSDRYNRSRMSYRFTVDVSDVLPVLVGPVRSWAIY